MSVDFTARVIYGFLVSKEEFEILAQQIDDETYDEIIDNLEYDIDFIEEMCDNEFNHLFYDTEPEEKYAKFLEDLPFSFFLKDERNKDKNSQ